jgi:two-component system, chemotaxis family, CheB/CheR fusion protein
VSTQSANTDQDFEGLLTHIRAHRGVDFTGYKRSTLRRRVSKRMQELGVDDYAGYVDALEASAGEFNALFDTILINVSSFFRDPAVWSHVADTLIPELLAHKAQTAPIRVWSAGCATGEEPYTVAMLLADALGERAFADRVKVFATDVDEKALERARQAVYAPGDLKNVPPHLRERFLERRGDQESITKDLRRAVIFGRNDLVRDAPISRIDLLTCRNTLIYFNSDAQRSIMARLHVALADDGFLVLGKSELPITFSDGFTPENLKLRIFRKVPGARIGADQIGALQPPGMLRHRATTPTAVVEAFRVSPVAQLVLDADGVVVVGNEPLQALFGVSAQDIGKPLQDLEISYRPVELRSLIEQAGESDHPVKSDPVRWIAPDGSEHCLDVEVTALRSDGAGRGTGIAFLDVTRHVGMAAELQSSKQELEGAYEDLQSTVEELETTNEELQSTNEELETTNEELQSTNEELETMNEELQSTNEELETTNEELRIRTAELNQANVLVESMLESLGLGVAVLDPDLRVTMWNEHSKKLWGLGSEEVHGRNFLNLDIGLPVELLRDPLRACVSGASDGEKLHVQARDRTGKDIVCEVQCAPLRSPRGEVTGAIVLMQAS